MRNFLFIAAMLSALALAPFDAQAHGKVTKTQPADGATLSAAPEKIVLDFPEAVRVTSFKLLNADGDAVEVEGGRSMEATKTITATPPALPAGTYRVEWRALSADGHPTKGGFSFTVQP